MKILVLSSVLPYPPEDGDKLRLYYIAKELSKKHSMDLIAFRVKGEEKYLKGLKGIFRNIKTVRLGKAGKLIRAFFSVFSLKPMNVAAYSSGEMKNAVKKALSEKKYDLIYVYRLRMAPYAENAGVPAVIDIVDALSLYAKRQSALESNPLRRIYSSMDFPRLFKYEKLLEKKFSFIFINSTEDAEFLGCKNIVPVSNGVKIKKGKPAKSSGFTAGFFGNMDYPPNYDAVLFFIKRVCPRAGGRGLKFVIAGKNSHRFKHLENKNVKIKGYIQNIDREIKSWDACVVPVRYGAGIQNKVLQAWADKVPVVAHSFAAKGVRGKDNVNLLIAEKPDNFLEKLLLLKENRKLRQRLVRGAGATLKKHFVWEKTAQRIDVYLHRAAIKKKRKIK